MTSDWLGKGSDEDLQRNALQSEAGPREASRIPTVLAIGLESILYRDGGLNRYFAELVAALGKLGTPVAGLVTGEPRPGDDELIEIVGPATAPITTRLRAIASGIRRHADTEVVDAHFALTALPVLCGRLRHRPLVVHFQGPWASESALADEGRLVCALKRRLERIVYRRADALVVLSEAFRRVLVESYGVSPWKIHVIPPAVDTKSFSAGDQSEARAMLGLPRDAFVGLAVRRLVPRMGLDVLLDAWADLVRISEVPILLCIVGTGPRREELEAQCAELGLEDVVRFVGRVDDKDLVRYYQAADVSIVPSVALEGFGLVVLESLATGTPVVASALDGLSEALEVFAPDLLVSPGDPKALGMRLGEALTGVKPLPTADECRRYAEGFSWTKVAYRHLELYAQFVRWAARERVDESRKARVVVLGHTAQLSGGELALLRVAPVLSQIQLHVILAQEGPLVPLLERAGTSVEVLPMGDRFRDLRKDQVRPGRISVVAGVQSMIYVFWLARRLRQVRPDLVHTNTLKSALYGGVAAHLAGVPCIWHIRDRIAPDYLPPSAVRIVHLAARLLPDRVIANSRATLETLPASTRARARVIYDAVSVFPTGRSGVSMDAPSSVVQKTKERASQSSATTNLRIAMVGRFAPWKGQDVFLKAFAQAFPDGEVAAILVGAALFGEHNFERQLRRLVGQLGIEKRVEFRGFRVEVFEELSQVDVLVHASVIPEPFGQVVLEGMAASLPVVAAGAGGPAEILVDGETGFLYPPGDVDALASLLRVLADDPTLRSRVGDRAHAAVALYSPDRVADQIRDVYDLVLAGSALAVSAGVINRDELGQQPDQSWIDGVANGT